MLKLDINARLVCTQHRKEKRAKQHYYYNTISIMYVANIVRKKTNSEERVIRNQNLVIR